MPAEIPAGPTSERLVVIIPCLNDTASLRLLLPLLDHDLATCGASALVLIVDDASSESLESLSDVGEYRAIEEVRVLRLRRNLGHQRAIATGLVYTCGDLPCRAVVVMDADGEDAPEDVPRLLSELGQSGVPHAVFASRARRTENMAFKLFYFLYRSMHLLLTGSRVRVGNFSVLPYVFVKRIVVAEELWNQYSSTVFKLRLPVRTIPADRGRRLAGRSKMSYTSLVVHGMSAISVYSDRVGVRMLWLFGGLTLVTLASMAVVVSVRLLTDWTIPGWASSLAGTLTVAFLQCILLWVVFVFVVLSGRAGSNFIPLRDCAWFIDGIVTIWSRSANDE
jgi:glycosyltransferase involved in cell wall biosynthesis